jgi:glyoxylase-like metal-dependent hydrolase (beta-lactamase superfamily II)
MHEIMHEKIIVGALETNCWLVPLEGEALGSLEPAAVIDPGGDADSIISSLDRRKMYPICILLTHGHFDHIEALPPLYRHYSDMGAVPQVAIHGDDRIYLGADSLAAHRRSFAAAGAPYYVDQLWLPMPDADTVLADGDKIKIFTVLHLPGHTRGSVAFFDEKNKRLYSGDTLFNAGVGRTDLPGGDADALEASLARLFKLDGDVVVFPGHGPSTTIERESRHWL